MGGCCCTPRGAGPNGTPTYTHSEEHEPLASPQDTSTISVGVPIDTDLVTSDLDTFRAPPAPLPFDVEPRHVTQADESLESSEKQDCKVKTDSETDASKLVDDEPLKLDKSVDSTIDEEDDCPICLEEYDKENPQITTKCEHHFHLSCILEWMERSDICPICDQTMIIDRGSAG